MTDTPTKEEIETWLKAAKCDNRRLDILAYEQCWTRNQNDRVIALAPLAMRGLEQEWRDIETAPKDGTVIQVHGGIAYWRQLVDADLNDISGWHSLTGTDWPGRRINWEVSKWMPLPTTYLLPEPPQPEAEDAADEAARQFFENRQAQAEDAVKLPSYSPSALTIGPEDYEPKQDCQGGGDLVRRLRLPIGDRAEWYDLYSMSVSAAPPERCVRHPERVLERIQQEREEAADTIEKLAEANRELAQKYDEARTRGMEHASSIGELCARVETLEKAIKPFADAADWIDQSESEGFRFRAVDYMLRAWRGFLSTCYALSKEDFIRSRNALKGAAE